MYVPLPWLCTHWVMKCMWNLILIKHWALTGNTIFSMKCAAFVLIRTHPNNRRAIYRTFRVLFAAHAAHVMLPHQDVMGEIVPPYLFTLPAASSAHQIWFSTEALRSITNVLHTDFSLLKKCPEKGNQSCKSAEGFWIKLTMRIYILP